MIVDEVGEGVAHADDGIVAGSRGLHVLGQGHPVALLDGPVEEGLLPPTLPPGLQRVLQHLVREVTGSQGKGGHGAHLLDQHDGIDTGAGGGVKDSKALVLLQQVDEEVLVVGRPVLLLADVEEPVGGGDPVGVLVEHAGLGHAGGQGLDGTHHLGTSALHAASLMHSLIFILS